MEREEEGATEQQEQGGGGSRVPTAVKEYLCDIVVEVIEDNKFDESIRIKIPGGAGSETLFCRKNIYMPPESKSTVKEIRRKF